MGGDLFGQFHRQVNDLGNSFVGMVSLPGNFAVTLAAARDVVVSHSDDGDLARREFSDQAEFSKIFKISAYTARSLIAEARQKIPHSAQGSFDEMAKQAEGTLRALSRDLTRRL